jgi:TetR/AcrR family transcriptional repressor of nem operon
METPSTGARRGPKPKPHVRENLLRVGVKMLHEGGFTGTGIKDIVDAAQVPKGSFYNYFENKEAFGKEAIDYFFDSGVEKLRERLLDENTPPLERLRHYFESRARGFRAGGYAKGCLLGNFSLEVADHSTLMRERLCAHFRTWSALFEACIEEAQKTGAIRNPLPPALLAPFLLNSWEGALLRMRAEKSDVPLNQFIEVVFESLLV